MSRLHAGWLLVSAFLIAPACGDNLEGVPVEIAPESVYAARCAAPRSGTDPDTGHKYPDVKGSVLDEQLWVRSWINDLYLWYAEVAPADPTQFHDALDYFAVEKTTATTPSGKPKDHFHFTYNTSDWVAMSESGVEASYGVGWALLEASPPRKLVVAYVDPGSPADGLVARGADVQSIDGVDVANGTDVDTLNKGLTPATVNESHTFVVVDSGSPTPRTVTLTSANITIAPVQKVHTLPPPNDKVGYFLFTDHLATAERALLDAMTQLRGAGITDLVIDLRYNGGGFLAIASELAYMVAGPGVTQGKAFERDTFNDKHQTTDPVTGQPLEPVPFLDQTIGLSVTAGTPLPDVGLRRVFVLTGPGTCSASEAVMNGLAGVGVEVIQIGETTCGKPYGFYPQDNCGTTFFAIQFQGVNEQGFGDYTDGFVPGGVLHGCPLRDDFTHALGDPAEGLLAAALGYATTGTCPATASALATEAPALANMTVSAKPLWRQNRIVLRRR